MKKLREELYCPFSEKCFECCLETEMILSIEDIKRIEKIGYKRKEFIKEKE